MIVGLECSGYREIIAMVMLSSMIEREERGISIPIAEPSYKACLQKRVGASCSFEFDKAVREKYASEI